MFDPLKNGGYGHPVACSPQPQSDESRRANVEMEIFGLAREILVRADVGFRVALEAAGGLYKEARPFFDAFWEEVDSEEEGGGA